MSNAVSPDLSSACTLIAGGMIAGDHAARAQNHGRDGPGAAAVRQARHAAEGRAAPVRRRPAHQGRADARHQEARGARHRDPHLPPAASVPQDGRARLRQGLRSTQVTARPGQDAVHLPPQRRHPVDRRSTSPMGPARRSTSRSSTPARPTAASDSSSPTRPIPRSRWRSGPRARPRTRTTGSPATTTPTTAPPAR